MSDASGDPLYRSDTRAAPSGAQQADLAPVSDQPSEYWEQQAAQRAAEDPAAPPTDPMGAQPQPASSDEGIASPASADAQPEQTAQPAPSSAPSTVEPASAQTAPQPSTPTDTDDARHGQTWGAATAADIEQDSSVTLGGEVAWSDPAGDHVRSGEVSVNLSQATTVGGELGAAAFGDQGGLILSGLTGPNSLSGAEGPLNQAIAAAQGVVAIVQGGGLSDAIDQAGTLPATLEAALDPALQTASAALDGLPSLTSPLDGLGQVDEAVSQLSSEGLESVLTADPIASAVEPLTGAFADAGSLLGVGTHAVDDIGDASSASSGPAPGLLASLFTPNEADAPVAESSILHDALPDLDLGGLLGSPDDQPDLGSLGL